MLSYWSGTGLDSTQYPFFSRYAQRALTVSGLRNWQTLFNRNWFLLLQCYGTRKVRVEEHDVFFFHLWCWKTNIYVIRMCLTGESSSHTAPVWHDISVEWRLQHKMNRNSKHTAPKHFLIQRFYSFSPQKLPKWDLKTFCLDLASLNLSSLHLNPAGSQINMCKILKITKCSRVLTGNREAQVQH